MNWHVMMEALGIGVVVLVGLVLLVAAFESGNQMLRSHREKAAVIPDLRSDVSHLKFEVAMLQNAMKRAENQAAALKTLRRPDDPAKAERVRARREQTRREKAGHSEP